MISSRFTHLVLSLHYVTVLFGSTKTMPSPASEITTDQCGENTFCKYYNDVEERLRTDEEFSNGLEVHDVTNLSTIAIKEEQQLLNNDDCPTFSAIANASDLNMRSVSPWKWVKNFDANRNPNVILEARWLCKYCYSLSEGTIDYSTYVTPIKVSRMVMYATENGEEKKELNTNLGYACAFSVVDFSD